EVRRILTAARDHLPCVVQRLDRGIAGCHEDSLEDQGVRLLIVDDQDLRRMQKLVVHGSTASRRTSFGADASMEGSSAPARPALSALGPRPRAVRLALGYQRSAPIAGPAAGA